MAYSPLLTLYVGRTATTGTPSQTLNLPTNTATSVSTTPDLEFTGVTSRGDQNISYEIQIDTVNTFNSQIKGYTPAFVEGQSVTNSTNTAVTPPFTNSFAVGQLVVVTAMYSGGANATQSIFDNASPSNQYNFIAGASGQVVSGGAYIAVYYSIIRTAKTSPTVTIQYNSAATNIAVTAQYFNGFVGTPILDISKLSVNTTSTTVTSGASGSTTQANELVVGMGVYDYGTNTTYSLGSGYSNLTQANDATNSVTAAMESKIVSAIGAQTATFTLATTNVNGGAVVSFYDSANAVPIIDKFSNTDMGFADITNGSNTSPFPSGEQIGYTPTSSLTASTTYYWRTQQIVPIGNVNYYKGWSSTFSFTTAAAAPSASIAQVAATITATGGTQVVAAVGDVAIAQTAATVTATGGTQAVASKQIVAISQSAATITASGGTQTLATVQNATIAQTAATLTVNGGTQSIGSVIDTGVTQLAATLTVSGGTQTVSAVQKVSIAQTAATLTVTGGVQAVATVNDKNITQVAATLTVTGGTQVVVAGSVASISLAQLAANLTATGGTQAVVSVQKVSIAQLAANLTGMGGIQVITGARDVLIAQLAASLTGNGGTQAVASTALINVLVSQVGASITAHGGTQSIVAVARLGRIEVYNGSSFALHPVNVWDGSTWVRRKFQYYDGTKWVTTL
jgi:fibronectin-binding autotransporter adhesin